MPASRRRLCRTAAVAIGGALLAAGMAACSDEPLPIADGSSMSAALRLVPDTGNTRRAIWITVYDRADRAAGTDTNPQGRAGELRRAATLLDEAGVAGGPLGLNQRTAQQYRPLGYRPSAVAAEITAGQRPETYTAAVASTTADPVLDAAAEVTGAQRREVHDTKVVRWLEDRQVDPSLEVPLGDLEGQAGRLAVPSNNVVVYAHSDRATEQLVGVASGDVSALSADHDIATAAKALDEAEAYSAYLSDHPIRSQQPRPRPGAPTASQGGLPRYRAIATGAAGTVAHPRMVLVLVDASERDAKTSVERLERTVATGISSQTARPWSEDLRNPRIERKGTVVVARFDVPTTRLWREVILRAEPFLSVTD